MARLPFRTAPSDHASTDLVPAISSVEIEGAVGNTRDGAAIRDTQTLFVKALKDTEIVLVGITGMRGTSGGSSDDPAKYPRNRRQLVEV
jgi:hypothetical protein